VKKPVESVVTGTVVKVNVEVGSAVVVGQTLVVLESMKMEIPITAESAGEVVAVHVAAGNSVSFRDHVLTLEVGD
jgi:biotin carboxyl carrier protein